MNSVDALDIPDSAPAPMLDSLGERASGYFAVSTLKLAVLSLCTLGLYAIYWFYRNWKLVKHRGADVSPIWRSLFGVFFCYSLLERMNLDFVRVNKASLPVGWLAAGWIILSVLARLPDPYWLVSLCAFGFLLPVQVAVNRLNRAENPRFDTNSRFGGWNIVTVVVGGTFLLLAIVGTFLPPDPL